MLSELCSLKSKFLGGVFCLGSAFSAADLGVKLNDAYQESSKDEKLSWSETFYKNLHQDPFIPLFSLSSVTIAYIDALRKGEKSTKKLIADFKEAYSNGSIEFARGVEVKFTDFTRMMFDILKDKQLQHCHKAVRSELNNLYDKIHDVIRKDNDSDRPKSSFTLRDGMSFRACDFIELLHPLFTDVDLIDFVHREETYDFARKQTLKNILRGNAEVAKVLVKNILSANTKIEYKINKINEAIKLVEASKEIVRDSLDDSDDIVYLERTGFDSFNESDEEQALGLGNINKCLCIFEMAIGELQEKLTAIVIRNMKELETFGGARRTRS